MIFIDAGYYHGAAIKLMEPDDDWKIYAFECSPEIETPEWVSREAVWVNNDGVEFAISGRNDASSIKGTSGHTDPKIVKVPSIDFSAFVGSLPDDTIVCSLDIEGAEFEVLEKMLKDGTADKLAVLDIEFHHRLMSDYDMDDARGLIKRLHERGVIVCLKIPLE